MLERIDQSVLLVVVQGASVRRTVPEGKRRLVPRAVDHCIDVGEHAAVAEVDRPCGGVEGRDDGLPGYAGRR